MEKITKTYKVYTYKELSKDAQEKVLDNNREINTEYDWFELEFEEMIERLSEMGFENAKIFFSGFYSQGDGACFTTNLEVGKLAKHFRLKTKYTKLLKAYEITGCIKVDGHYSHSNTMNIELDFEPFDTITTPRQILLDEMSEKFEDEILQLARDEADKIYKELQEAYEYLTSEESIVETFEANEYAFLEDGKTFNE